MAQLDIRNYLYHTIRGSRYNKIDDIFESILKDGYLLFGEDLKKLPVNKLYKGMIIPGTELEFAKDGRLFDMLGYGMNLEVLKNTEIMQQGMVHSTIEGQTKILNQLKLICFMYGR